MRWPSQLSRNNIWRWAFAAILAGGLYATYIRIVYGLGGATNLSDKFPWGLWVGFDLLCGVGLAAGGFTLAAIVYVFNVESYKPILRATILTAFLGYGLVIVALLYDLGRPYRIWHAIIMWNPRSVMFEVAWCVMLYTAVLALEFAPAVLERVGWRAPLGWMQALTIPLVIVGVLLSTLHQSSLGSLFLIVPLKLYPLWYTPLLPVFFFLSALCVGFAMPIFESWHSSRVFGRQLERPLLASMARVLAVLLSVNLSARFLDLWHRGALPLLVLPRRETYWFALETLLLVAPMALLFQSSVRLNGRSLYTCAVLVIAGFVVNRLNVSIIGMEAGSGATYWPRWSEVMITVMLVALGIAIFRMAVRHLPVFLEHSSPQPVLPVAAD